MVDCLLRGEDHTLPTKTPEPESRFPAPFFAQMNAERNKEKNVETNERRKRIGQLDLQLTSIVPLRALPHFKYRSLKS